MTSKKFLQDVEDLIQRVEKAEKKDFFELVKIAGLNPAKDLAGANLSGANLSGANLSAADLSDADLSDANLNGADLSGADLSRADLSRALLIGANLSGADLSGANLSLARLSGANLSGANLSGANLSLARLSGANLSRADLSGADLSGTHLSRADLSGANLSGADLSGANLSGANLSRADLSGANLSGANLREADLTLARLSGANLREADLTSARLSGANLREANLSITNLSGANLSGANLSGLDLSRLDVSGFDLSGANLREVDLSGANLSGLDLSGFDFSGANLSGANLSGANLREANLTGASLERAYLIAAQALGTNFNTAKFTGACLEDWNINNATNLDGVICDYVYRRDNQQERRPSSGNFAPGEFTKLFKKSLETVDLIFRNGIDWKAFLTSFQKLQVEGGGEELSIQAIENKNNGAFVIRVNVPFDANKAEIEKYLKGEYEFALKALEKKYRYQLQAKDEQLAGYRQRNTDLTEIVKLLAARLFNNVIEVTALAESESMSETSKYNLSSAKFGGGFAGTGGTQTGGTFNYYSSNSNLSEAATEIQQLLKQLEATNPTTTSAEKMTVVAKAVDKIEKEPSLKARVIAALNSGGTEAFKQAINHPLTKNMVPIIQEWAEAE